MSKTVSDPVIDCKSFFKYEGKLVGKSAPILVSDLILEAVQNLWSKANKRQVCHKLAYLVEHLLQVLFGTVPRGDRIAEEYKLVDNACWIDANHSTDASKSGVFFLVIPNITQRGTPEQQTIRSLVMEW